MTNAILTDAQVWIISHGFYGHWWNFPPYNTKGYQARFDACMEEYNKRWAVM